MKSPRKFSLLASLVTGATILSPTAGLAQDQLSVKKDDRIVLIGAGMASRMIHFGHFETELFLRYPDSNITIRNMGDEGNTPGFRPQPGRNQDQQYAFPGAKELLPKALQASSKPKGFFETPDQWLTRLEADTVIAFFGFNSSFEGPDGLERYKKELDAFIKHTLKQKYNGSSAPQLALVSPTAMQDLSAKYGIPSFEAQDKNIELYTAAMKEITAANKVLFFDAHSPSKKWYADGEQYTVDGALLNDKGYKALAPALANALFGSSKVDESKRAAVHAAVTEKNWCWLNDFKIPNGVHVYGRRYKPYGPDNYPYELKKTREMTALRDQNIWATLNGKTFDLAAADAKTSKLPPVETNYKPKAKKMGVNRYLPVEQAQTELKTAEGYKIEAFASEKEFPLLRNPVQISFDNKGRLWVATMASYPHHRIGDPKPQDNLLILEDTNNDGKADKQTIFAGDLHIPIGFEIAHDGVYVSQSGSLVFLQDTDGDDHYDTKEVLLSGFDDHDTHHAISAFNADPSGAIVMGEGVFLHSNVETAYGPQRGTNGGFFRYSPQRKHLMRLGQFSIPNPWGISVDDYGQTFFLHTSSTKLSWMNSGMIKARYGANMTASDLVTSNSVRPTSGVEMVSSRHFPDDQQGDVLINNNIGFLGAKQHKLLEDGAGFTTEYRHDLYKSNDLNFRPVDLEFAPDGSLYVADWQNALIGHMQHNARDPLRDHEHGRIYRVTYPSRPLVKPAKIAGASLDELFANLKLPEYRTRYRTRRELRGHDADTVAAAAAKWAATLGDDEGQTLLEALWVTWGADRLDEGILNRALKHKDHKVRAGALQTVRYNTHRISNPVALIQAGAEDEHGRVRIEAMTAATYLSPAIGLEILATVEKKGLSGVHVKALKFAKEALQGKEGKTEETHRVKAPKHLNKAQRKLFTAGAEIYAREGYCATCHQENGKGLPAAGFPPLSGTKWVNEDPERVIKLTLHGLMGPIEVNGKKYPGQVPMSAFGALLNDKEVASVLTYVRNSFGNKAKAVSAKQVAAVRKATSSQKLPYNAPELLKEHPHAK